MENNYVDFISNEHLLHCVGNLHDAYVRAKNNITKQHFYANKVDSFKLTFDAKFNGIDEQSLIQSEILRQIDKSINNSIGTFHEQVLGGVKGYEVGNLSGYDIKATDDSLFADIKNKHNTMNSSSAESLFQKLKTYADNYKNATCYWVQILATTSFNKKWESIINGKEYSHSRVFKISGDRFYALLTGQDYALIQLYKALPRVVKDYLNSMEQNNSIKENSAIDEIKSGTEISKRTILDQITFENYSYYLGFDKL